MKKKKWDKDKSEEHHYMSEVEAKIFQKDGHMRRGTDIYDDHNFPSLVEQKKNKLTETV